MNPSPLLTALLAAAFLLTLSSPAAAQETPDTWDRLNAESTSRRASTELALGQGIHGMILGIEACNIAGCENLRLRLGLPLLGAIAGTTTALILTGSDGTEPGLANTFNSAPTWGYGLGFGTSYLLDLSDRGSAAARMIGMSAGLSSAYFLADRFRPTAGDVALVNAAALWSLAYYLAIVEGIADRDQSPRARALGMMTTAIVAGALGGLATTYYPMSRGRVAIIQATGLGGGLLGVIIAGTESDRRTFIATLITATAGLALGTYLTRNY